MGSWSNYLGSSVFADVPFLVYLALHRKGRGGTRWDPSHVTPRVAYTLQNFRSVAPLVFLAKIPFLAICHYYGNYFPNF